MGWACLAFFSASPPLLVTAPVTPAKEDGQPLLLSLFSPLPQPAASLLSGEKAEALSYSLHLFRLQPLEPSIILFDKVQMCLL